MSATVRRAIAYAEMGWRVHPCQPKGKLPILKGWPERASADPETVASWWRQTPDANIAIATGAGSGCFVVDVDGRDGEQSLADLERRHGAMPDLFPMQWTGGGRGGWHAVLQWPDGREFGNRVLGPKLDSRCHRGYVLVPPSVTTETYRWADDRDPWSIPPEPAPDWLVDLLDPPKVARDQVSPVAGRFRAGTKNGDDPGALRTLEDQIKLVAWAPNGERNSQLFSAGLTLFWMVDAGRLSKQGVTSALRDAAESAGLSAIEVQRTLASAASRRGVTL